VVHDANGSSTGLRRQLVGYLRRQGHLRDRRIAAAFIAVPRETFLAEHAERDGLAVIYRDDAIVTRRDPETGMPLSSSSQPAIMAEMLEMLAVEPGQRVLEVGAGTGYNAALLARLAGPNGEVTSVELDPELAADASDALQAAGAEVRVVAGDGRSGWGEAAPFDAMIATASTESIPRAWHDQLVPGGRLVVPLRLSSAVFSVQAVMALRKVAHGFDTVAVTPGGFMALRGPGPTPSPNGEAAQVLVGSGTDDPFHPPLLMLTGSALASLDRRERGRLIVTALGFARRAEVDLGGATPWALASYVALALPEERTIQCVRGVSPAALGVLDAVDGSVALLSATPAGARREAYGGHGAERALSQTIDRWVAAGRPAVDRLSVTVRYRAERPHGWRSVRRGDQWIAFDWINRLPG
jgi:protein-L-isoaspartate(D-aspartate) O-methyltransferase